MENVKVLHDSKTGNFYLKDKTNKFKTKPLFTGYSISGNIIVLYLPPIHNNPPFVELYYDVYQHQFVKMRKTIKTLFDIAYFK